jgi:hypothetical protein
MNSRAKMSIAVIIAIILIIGVSLFMGINTAVPIGGSKFVTIDVLGSSQYYGAANVINLTYSSVGIHVMYTNYSSWEYYNTTQSIEFGGNKTYQLARFSIPVNSVVDTAELTLSSANTTVSGLSYPVLFPARRQYFSISSGYGNQSITIMLDMHQTAVPVINGTSLLFAAKQYSTVEVLNSSAAYTQEPVLNSSLILSSANVSGTGNSTYVRIAVHNSGTNSAAIYSVVLKGNIIVAGNVSYVAALEGIATALNSSTLNGILPSINTSSISDIPGISQISGVIANNTGFFSSIASKLPPSIKGILSNSSLSLSHIQLQNITASAGQYLSDINSSEYKDILVNTLSNISLAGNSTYLHNQNISELESIISNLGGIKNSAVYNGLVSGIISTEYTQYVSRSSSLRSAETGLDAVAFAVTSNGRLVQLQDANQLNSTGYGFILSPGQTAVLSFKGAIQAVQPGTFFTTAINNTYKIFVLGNNSIANATVVSR